MVGYFHGFSPSQVSATMKYFDNNWQEYKDAPEGFFHEHSYEDIMTWKVAGWEFPSSVHCVIREANVKTGKVKEHVYRRAHAARAKVQKLLLTDDIELTVADHESIIYLRKRDLTDLGIEIENLFEEDEEGFND